MSRDKDTESKMVDKSLRDTAIQQCIQITNIVCIGHMSLVRSSRSVVQHIAASSIAEKLMALYAALGRPLAAPIDIVAQDPSYTANDKHLLSLLPRPIRVVTDPEGFLAVNENGLAMSCCPTVPVKRIVADVAADSGSGKGPTALLWHIGSWDEEHGGVDAVTGPGENVIGFSDPGSRGSLDMLEGYTKMIDGAEMFSNRFVHRNVVTIADAAVAHKTHECFEWLSGMELWARLD